MISFLETFSNIVYCIILFKTVRVTYITLVLIVTLYMVVLPYAFLMNTSHNKNRIVEHGWKNVFKNMLGRSSQNKVVDGHTSKNSINVKKESCKSSNSQTCNVKQEIFTISSPSVDKARKKDGNSSKDISFKSEPCSSKGHQELNALQSSKVTTLDAIEPIQQIAKEEKTTLHMLVSKMIQHIHDEEGYLELFRKLVAYQYRNKDDDPNPEFELEFEMLPNHVPSTTVQDDHNKIKGKKSNKSHGKIKYQSTTQSC